MCWLTVDIDDEKVVECMKEKLSKWVGSQLFMPCLRHPSASTRNILLLSTNQILCLHIKLDYFI